MSTRFKRSGHPTFLGFDAPTSSQGLEAGNSLSRSQAGPRIAPSGPAVAPVSLFHKPEGAEALLTSGTCGLFGEDSSPSAVLQRSLESRLIQRMAAYGSIEYALTWKRWAMPSGPPICALRALRHRTSGRDFIGWPSPMGRDGKHAGKDRPNRTGGPSLAQLTAGWATPNAWDSQGSHGGGQGASLRTDAQMAVHGTKRSGSPAGTEKRGALNPDLARWLMGFPAEWDACAPMATPSSPSSRLSSLGQRKRRS